MLVHIDTDCSDVDVAGSNLEIEQRKGIQGIILPSYISCDVTRLESEACLLSDHSQNKGYKQPKIYCLFQTTKMEFFHHSEAPN